MTRRILLFAKPARPGRAKTRLAPLLGEEGAARLYEALLDDTLERLCGLETPVELHVSPGEGSVSWFRSRYPSVEIRPQRGDGLGERLAAAFAGCFRRGGRAAMAVGSDHPTIPRGFLREGLDALAERDAVLGPGRDGGYYAVAIRRSAWPAARALFDGIPWSTERVAEATRRAAARAGLDLGELPEWYDVDRPGDLPLLRRDAEIGSRSLRVLERLTAQEPVDGGEAAGGGRW